MKQGKPKYSSNPNNSVLTDQSKYKYDRVRVLNQVNKKNKVYNSMSKSGDGNVIG